MVVKVWPQVPVSRYLPYKLVSISSARGSHTEESTSPGDSRNVSSFSRLSKSTVVRNEPGLMTRSSGSPLYCPRGHSTSLYFPEGSLINISLICFFKVWSGQNRYSYSAAARIPPRSGPTQYTFGQGIMGQACHFCSRHRNTTSLNSASCYLI